MPEVNVLFGSVRNFYSGVRSFFPENSQSVSAGQADAGKPPTCLLLSPLHPAFPDFLSRSFSSFRSHWRIRPISFSFPVLSLSALTSD